MFALELSPYALTTPHDAYATLSRNPIRCTTLSQEYCKLIGGCWKIMRRQLCPNRY